jgi:hypothetical protein
MIEPNDILHVDPAVEAVEYLVGVDPAVMHAGDLGKKVGFIQSRGLGDLFIALPIAGYYMDEGYSIYWPICEEFLATMQKCAPWVHWLPIKTDPQGAYFYDKPMVALKYNVEQENIINLMQFLSSRPQDSDPDIFPILKFDQYKYARAGVPFLNKWKLGDYLVRDPVAEAALKRQVCPEDRPYIVAHLEGSTARATLDFSEAIAAGYDVVYIKEGIAENAVNWLGVIEGASELYMIDSCFSNLVDQLDIQVDKVFLRRSKMDLTPVLGSNWTYMTP